MSARTPFVPMNSRPASRANVKESSQLTPDPSNPLHENAAVKAKQPAGESETQTANLAPKTPFHPLNTSNLLKKSSTATVNRTSRNAMPRRSASVVENTATHASESRTDLQPVNNRHNIVSPTPVSASHPDSPLFSNNAAAGMFTNPAFKLPMNPALQTSPDMKTTDIPLETMALNPVPKVYKLNTAHSKQNGPQRVFVDTNGSQSRFKRGMADAETDEHSFEREQQKRFKVDHDGEDTKITHGNGYSRPRAYSPQTIISSPVAESRRSNSEYSPGNNQQQPPEYQTPPTGFSRDEFFFNPNAFNRMLGRDADVYVEEQADKYEQLAAKWRDCTMEEWLAGANEITVKYGKILDLVKSHINSKLTLFASLHTHLDDYNSTLVERQKTLGGAKQKLLSEAGNLLGKDN